MNGISALQEAHRTGVYDERLRDARACDDLEECITAGCGKRRTGPGDVSRVLLRYWLELPVRPAADRAAVLANIVRRMGTGELSRRALVPIAIGDPAQPIVVVAVKHYIGNGLLSIERKKRLVHDAIEWIRRGLALNRPAVFAALLATGDEETLARLGALRLLFDADETSRVHAQFADEKRPTIVAFLDEWRAI